MKTRQPSDTETAMALPGNERWVSWVLGVYVREHRVMRVTGELLRNYYLVRVMVSVRRYMRAHDS